jgi:Tfp pilus assembly protein PilE
MKLAGFFFIGLIINLLVLAVFASWAYKQWNKRP